MKRHKEFTHVDVDENARIDVIFDIEDGKVVHFSINLSWINEKAHDVYRVDTFHGFLHEHKFWISDSKVKLDMDWHHAFNVKLKEVKKNYRKWVRLFQKKRKKR